MKCTANIAYVVCGLWVNSAIAVIPFTLSGPVPALSTDYRVGTTNTYIYTLTNKVKGLAVPLTVSGLSGPTSRTTVVNDCRNQTPVGPSTCNIGVTIAPTSGNAGQTYQQTLAVDYQGRTPLTTSLKFTVPTSGGVSFSVVGGKDVATDRPTLAQSIDGGVVWNTLLDIPNYPSEGRINTSSCTGGTLCIAAGGSGPVTSPAPFVVQSDDQGLNWTIPALVGTEGIRAAIAGSGCTGNGTTAICVAVGVNTTETTARPLLTQTTNGGAAWSTITVPGATSGGRLNAASCTGNSRTAICTAAGIETTPESVRIPLLIQTTNGGATWSGVSSLSSRGRFNAINCSGADSTATCVAAGVDFPGTSLRPYLFQTTNGGATWSAANLINIAGSELYGVSCTGNSPNTACTAVGFKIATTTGVILHTSDNGANWTDVSPDFLPSGSTLNTVACVGDSSNGFCVAAGSGTGGSVLIQSNDGGDSWNAVNVAGLTTSATLVGSSCKMNNDVPVCTVVGDQNGAPLLLQTLDGGSNWSIVNVTDAPSSGEYGTASMTAQ